MNKVFVIDDEKDYGELIADVAELFDFDCIYSNAPENLESLLIEHPDMDLIFLDLNMPKRDGIELIRALADYQYQGHLVIMSGFDESVLSTAFELASKHDLKLYSPLMKPFGIQAISQLLEDHRKIDNNPIAGFPSKQCTESRSLNATAILEAFEHDRLTLHYQPQVDLTTMEITGVEVLSRIQDGDQLIYPDCFIPVIEEHSLNGLFLEHILKNLIKDCNTLLADYLDKINCAINISALDLNDLDFPDRLARKILENGLNPSNFVIEITESSAIKHLHTGLDILARLRLKHFHLSIDDFGTGTAVLENIKIMPFSELKIDRLFIEKMLHDKRSETLTHDTIQMAKHMNLKVVAEGIEDFQTAQKLSDMGCDIAQGYYFAKPMPITQLLEYIKQNKSKETL